jgi:uncharacterized protein (TIGR02145 family)
MKVFFLFVCLLAVSKLFSQSIRNVDFWAEGKTIVVEYDFINPKQDTSINVILSFSDQRGVIVVPKTITGDFKNVNPGLAKRIVWHVLTDGITLSGNYRAEVGIKKIAALKFVKIGTQIWASENLNVDHYRNGDPIPEAKTVQEWIKAGENKQPAWCYYENNSVNGSKYGKLYNWYAVNDSRGLAPEGWHLPSNQEWKELEGFLGIWTEAGEKMKSINGWKTSGNNTNSSGFSAIPGGYRSPNGAFKEIGAYGCWWSTTENTSSLPFYIILDDSSSFLKFCMDKEYGLSLRCIRD